jgi:mono/diheme cytochrome c family protein
MSCYRKIFNKALAGLLFAAILIFSSKAMAADGAALFKANCSNCHNVAKETGVAPWLKGVRERIPSPDWVYGWVSNSSGTNDSYAKTLKAKWNNSVMTAFGNQFKKEDVDAILDYVDTYVAPP